MQNENRPLSEVAEVCVKPSSTSTTVLPTIVTGIQTSVPLLVQAANGAVYLLSTPNIQGHQFGGGYILPTSTNIEFLPANPTLILPSHQQLQQQSFFTSTSSGSFYSGSQNESDSLLNSALQAAVTASTIAATQNQQLLSQQHQQQLRRQTQSFGNSAAKVSTHRKNGSSFIGDPGCEADKRKISMMSEGIKNVDNNNDDDDAVPTPTTTPTPTNAIGNRSRPKIFIPNGKVNNSDIVRAAMLENNITWKSNLLKKTSRKLFFYTPWMPSVVLFCSVE